MIKFNFIEALILSLLKVACIFFGSLLLSFFPYVFLELDFLESTFLVFGAIIAIENIIRYTKGV